VIISEAGAGPVLFGGSGLWFIEDVVPGSVPWNAELVLEQPAAKIAARTAIAAGKRYKLRISNLLEGTGLLPPSKMQVCCIGSTTRPTLPSVDLGTPPAGCQSQFRD
jgi:hypothetical protein